MSRGVRIADVKRDWGNDDSATPILHVDMDAFFVSVELLDQPQLRNLPVAVGGPNRGVISAASYVARTFGVNSAMSVAEAKRRCPQLVLLPVNMPKYVAVSRKIMRIFHEVTPLVEQISVDEAFLDVSGARKLFGTPTQIAHLLRSRIRAEIGVPASIGIANTKHLAKLASTHAKPDGLLLVPAQCAQDFLNLLPIGALWGVGAKTAQRLQERGVDTVRDAIALGVRRLQSLAGNAAGAKIYALATNHDPRRVEPIQEEKSISREQTFFDCLTSFGQVRKVLLSQSHDVGRRLRKHGFRARTISIKIRNAKFETFTRSHTLGAATDLGGDIFREAVQLFQSGAFPASGIRLLGVSAENLQDTHAEVQGLLGEDDRAEKAERAIDLIQQKYGHTALNYATLASRAQAK